MNKIYCIALLLTNIIYGQSLKGIVVNSKSEPIVNCMVSLKFNAEIIDFTKTNENGFFEFEELELKKYEVEFYKKNFERKNIFLNISKENNEIVLVHKFSYETVIEEVVIKKENSIINKKDTLVYDVKSLRKAGDNVVEDLLKRLPGISVDKTGSIFYKGKEIKSFMIDGDNIFNENYVTGSKNINLDLIEKIEAIDNFDENSITRGIKKSNEVALNLKTNKGIKYSLTSDLKTDFHKEYEGSLFGLLLKKNKGYVYLDKNNIGKIQKDNFSKLLSSSRIEELEVLNEKLFNESNYYFSNYNNQNSISANYLLKYKDKIQNNFGLIFNNDNITKSNLQNINYYNESDDYNSITNLRYKPTQYGVDYNFNYYDKKIFSINNRFKFLNDNSDFFNEELRNDFLFYRKNNYKKSTLYNNLVLSLKVSKNSYIESKIILFTSKTNQYFQNNSNITSLENFKNNFKIESDLYKISNTFSHNFSYKSRFRYEFELTENTNQLNTTLNKFKTLNNFFNYYHKLKKLTFDGSFNINQNTFSNSSKKLNVLPKINLKYSLTKKLSLSNDFNSSITYPKPLRQFTNIMNIYSDSRFMTENFSLYKNLSNRVNLTYLDLLKTRQVSFSFTKNYKTGDLYVYNKFKDNLFIRNYQFVNKANYDLDFEFQALNYFYFIKTTIDFKYNYQINKSYYLSNNELKPNVIYNNFFAISFKKELFKKISIVENFTFITNKSKNENFENKYKNFENNFSLKYQIIPSALVSIEYIQLKPDFEQKFFYHFLNLNFNYKCKNKVEITMTGINMFNNFGIYNIMQSSASLTIYESSIHERTMLLGLKYIL